MNLDLVRQRDRFKAGIKDIRGVFEKLEASEGFSEQHTGTWRKHWDYQLYKVLECQYARGLECLNETLPSMEVKLTFKHKRLAFEPALEDIRTQHYKIVKDFIKLPHVAKGFSELSTGKAGFFRPMADQQGAAVAKVYEQVGCLLPHTRSAFERERRLVGLHGRLKGTVFNRDNTTFNLI
jgi:dynein heavy chain 2